MPKNPVRERLALAAATLLLERQEHDLFRARRRAARQLGLRHDVADLPSAREIRSQLERLSQILSSGAFRADPRRMELDSLRLMRRFRDLHPLLRDPATMSGPKVGWEILIRLHGDDFETVTDRLRQDGLEHHAGSLRHGAHPLDHFIPIDVRVEFNCRLAVYPSAALGRPWLRPDSGAPVSAVDLDRLEVMLQADGSRDSLELELVGIDMPTGRFDVLRMLLERLDGVRLDPAEHPEVDALFHSLQVFDLAATEFPWDEELLSAALLHEVGRALDTEQPVPATLEALDGLVTHRTLRLIEALPEASLVRARSAPVDVRHRIEASEDYQDLMQLADFDRRGRIRKTRTSTVDEALGLLESLDGGGEWDDDPYRDDRAATRSTRRTARSRRAPDSLINADGEDHDPDADGRDDDDLDLDDDDDDEEDEDEDITEPSDLRDDDLDAA
jgi:predicted HD phosphohydrolase